MAKIDRIPNAPITKFPPIPPEDINSIIDNVFSVTASLSVPAIFEVSLAKLLVVVGICKSKKFIRV